MGTDLTQRWGSTEFGVRSCRSLPRGVSSIPKRGRLPMRLVRGQDSSSIRPTRIAGQNLCRVFDDGVDGRPIGLAVEHADPPGRGLDLPVRPRGRGRPRYHSEKGWAMRLALK